MCAERGELGAGRGESEMGASPSLDGHIPVRTLFFLAGLRGKRERKSKTAKFVSSAAVAVSEFFSTPSTSPRQS